MAKMRFYGREFLLLGEKNNILLLCVRRHVPKSSARRMVTNVAADMMWAYAFLLVIQWGVKVGVTFSL